MGGGTLTSKMWGLHPWRVSIFTNRCCVTTPGRARLLALLAWPVVPPLATPPGLRRDTRGPTVAPLRGGAPGRAAGSAPLLFPTGVSRRTASPPRPVRSVCPDGKSPLAHVYQLCASLPLMAQWASGWLGRRGGGGQRARGLGPGSSSGPEHKCETPSDPPPAARASAVQNLPASSHDPPSLVQSQERAGSRGRVICRGPQGQGRAPATAAGLPETCDLRKVICSGCPGGSAVEQLPLA